MKTLNLSQNVKTLLFFTVIILTIVLVHFNSLPYYR